MTDGELACLTPEAKARIEIDRMLAAAGWVVQDARAVNLSASQGVAVREFVLKAPHGRADYLLFVDGTAVGVVEAKKEGQILSGVAWQTAKYVEGVPEEVPTALEGALPFAYESTGTETHFTNTLDPDAASREVFSFHRPETLAGWIADIAKHPTAPTLRHRLRTLPPLTDKGLWPAQFRAISNLDESLAAARPRALIQMATGSGKTFTAPNVAYDDLIQRDKVSLDITWLRDAALEDMDDLPPPDVLAQEIVDDLEAAIAEFSAVAQSLGAPAESPRA